MAEKGGLGAGKVGGGLEVGGGLGDILSMALSQTGVDSMTPAQITVDHSSILSAAANTLDSSLLSTDINVLTEGLFSTLAKENSLRKEKDKAATRSSSNVSTTAPSSAPATVQSTVNQQSNSTLSSQLQQPPPPLPVTTTSATGINEVLIPGATPVSGHLSIAPRPPSESEMRAAQLLKAELKNSSIDDDIDLDELLAGGGDSIGDIDEMSLFTGSVDSTSTNSVFNSGPSDPFLLPSTPSLTNTTSPATSSFTDPLSSLLNLSTTSQHSEKIGSTPVVESTIIHTVATTTVGDSANSTVPVGALSIATTTVQSKTSEAKVAPKSIIPPSLSSTETTVAKTRAPLLSLLPSVVAPLTTPPLSLSSSSSISSSSSSSSSPSTSLTFTANTKPSILTSVATVKKPTLSTTKLDLAAILREVTKMSPSSLSTSRAGTVSVTVVPPAAVHSALGGGAKTQGFLSLPGGVSLLAKTPNALQRVSALLQSKTAGQLKKPAEQEEESDDEEEEWAAITTYSNYKPAKLDLGHSHPDPIVESSSLSSVEPPQVWFDLKLPPSVIEQVQLSSLQLEAVVYACQQHMNILADGSRAGFLIGDGAGVGKGRTIAGIIYQNYLEGRKKAIWLSVSNDLKYDAMRDLRDVGAKKIDVYSLNKFYYGKISGKRNGRVRKGVIFSTYSSLIGESSSGGKYRTRLNQLLHWLGQFEGVIVFDECHKAKNLVPTGASKPSKTGLTVLQLQKKLPKARIVYCSATGASEPRNMAYMSRLGIWGPNTQFPTFHDFIKAVERRGVGAMEIVAMDMKLRGMYIARQLSFSGVTFDIREVALTDRFIEMYDSSVEMWVEAKKLFQEAADLMDYDRKKLKTMWGQFWASHQRFFKYLCIAAKVQEVINIAKKGLMEGKCVVIGLQSTGEARTLEQLEQNNGELSGFISTAKGVLESLIKRHFPAPNRVGMDWALFDSDPTLPSAYRKRKRSENRGPMFQDEHFSSDSDDSSSADGDSAVESSSDEGEGGEAMEGVGEQEEKEEDESGETSDDDSDSDNNNFNPFGLNDDPEPWGHKSKPKRRKTESTLRIGNFSIQPPPSSAGGKGKGKTKTGFNSKSLKFEPVGSPKEVPRGLPDRRQSVAVAEGISNLVPPPSLREQMSSQGSVQGEGSSLLNIMSSSAMTTGSNSSLRNITVKKMKDELLRKLEVLSPHLPPNTLDELIDGLGGPHRVAEMTGRRGRVVSLPDGSVHYQLRSESDVSLEMLNLTEKQRFMDGDKNIAIISEAASSGISLQSDRRAKNHRRRLHITLELPWSADKAIQQFGRTHRSNQVNAPEYVFLISQLAGEQRFASVVAKRLESLGALTHGDRRATESRDLSKYNVDTKHGRQALETVLVSILNGKSTITDSEEYSVDFLDSARRDLIGVDILTRGARGLYTLEKDSATLSRFLNRLLGLPVKLQNKLFAYFTDTLASLIKKAKRTGSWDGGIRDFGGGGEEVEIVDVQEYVGDPAYGTATTQLHKILVERGLPFSDAVTLLNTDPVPGEGFYISKKPRNEKHVAVLLKVSGISGGYFSVHRPNTGRQTQSEKLRILQKKYSKVDVEEAEKWWMEQYESSLSVCSHAFWQGKCKLSTPGQPCEIGLRRRHYYILAGSVLGVWTHLEGVLGRHGSHNTRMQIARAQTVRKRLVGILIPSGCVNDLRQTLTKIAEQAAGVDLEEDSAIPPPPLLPSPLPPSSQTL